MTQQKAASLTSSLFARKGKASPASLLISELQNDDAEAESPAIIATVGNGNGTYGTGIKIPVSELSGVTGRKKATVPEVELPLLDFVEAQIAANPVVVEADEPETTAKAATPVPSAKGLRPAASLLDRGLEAAPGTKGRTEVSATESTGPAESDKQAPIEAEIVIERDAGEAIESETVSGDANVAAIVDAPQDMSLDDARQDLALPDDTAEPVVVEAQTDDGPAEPAADSLGPKEQVGATESVIIAPISAAETATEEDTGPDKPGEERLVPTHQGSGTADAPTPATLALRNAAALHPAGSLPEAAVMPPPAATRAALPWRSAAVVALGAVIGLAGYVAFSDKPAEVPAERSAPVEAATTPEAATDPATEASPQAEAAEIAPGQVGTAAPETATSAEAPVAPEPEPSFDVIRIESNGQSIIAGRAEPLSEWILLNNGRPIASVRADAYGEWVVLPDASLVPGANAFSLVPKTERGKVAIPAPSAPGQAEPAGEAEAPMAPRSDAGGDMSDDLSAVQGPAYIALPKPKPSLRAAAPQPVETFRVASDGVYEVQVASVRQSADAQRELGRLAAAFPTFLGELDLRVQEASVEGAGTFFRVRSGAVEDLGVAREICRLLEAQNQGCLVVRRAPTPKAPQTENVPDTVQTRSAAQQQAERPQ